MATAPEVCTANAPTSRDRIARMRPTSPGTSKTSWTHSRTASKTIGKDGVAAGHLEQLRGALALLPEGLTAVRATAGQQQGPRRALAEPGGEQGRTADLGGDEVGDLVGVEQDEVEQLLGQLAHRSSRCRRRH
jgi:hypothetical protein